MCLISKYTTAIINYPQIDNSIIIPTTVFLNVTVKHDVMLIDKKLLRESLKVLRRLVPAHVLNQLTKLFIRILEKQ